MGLLLLIATIGFVGYSTYSRDGLKSRRVTQVNASITSGFDGGDLGNMINECGIKDDAIRSLFRMCAKDKRDHVRFALMGDSKAEALYTGLVRTSNADGRWLFIGGNGPHGAPVPLLSSDADPQRPLTHYAIEAITHNDEIETVVLVTAARALFGISDGVKGGNLATYDYTYFRQLSSSKRFGDVSTELSRVVSKFVAKGKRVVLVVDNPALPNPSDCINRKTLLKQGKFNEDRSLDANVFNEQIKLYKRLLEDIKLAHPDFVQIFDPTDIYCDQTSGLCEAIKNERLMYAYTDHISDYAAGLVGRRLNHVLTAR